MYTPQTDYTGTVITFPKAYNGLVDVLEVAALDRSSVCSVTSRTGNTGLTIQLPAPFLPGDTVKYDRAMRKILVERAAAELILDSSRNWTIQKAGVNKTDDTCEVFMADIPGFNDSGFVMTHFKTLNWSEWTTSIKEGAYMYWQNRISIKVSHVTLGIVGKPALADFIRFLNSRRDSGDPITLKYKFAQKTTEDITNTQTGQALLELPAYQSLCIDSDGEVQVTCRINYYVKSGSSNLQALLDDCGSPDFGCT